jgi:thioredoxin reductase (NADPH)
MDKPVILAVDDDPQVLRQIGRDLVKRFGEHYSVLRADSGRAALDALDELAGRAAPVALLLSDQRMPGMDGVTFLKQARERYPDSKRALLTAYADTDAAIAAINESQVDYYLTKPWEPPDERLYPVVTDLLDDWRAAWRPGFGGLRVIGSRWMPQVQEIRDFLSRNQIPYQFLDIERSEEACAMAAELEGGEAALPLVILADGQRLTQQTVHSLAPHLKLQTAAANQMYDFAIVGGGPAGLAAAVYGASEGLSTIMLEREAPGGQAGTSSRIENYLGFPSGLSGQDLARRAVTQAQRFHVEIISPQNICALKVDGPYKTLTCGDSTTINCKALLLATGVAWRKLPAEGAEQLTGRGIYYGAVTIDPGECEGEEIYVVGAGNSAGQAASYLAEHRATVTMVVRGASLGDKMSQYLVTRIEANERIRVRCNAEVTRCEGSEQLDALTVVDRLTGAEERVPARYLFVFIGAAPNTDWLGDLVARDKNGFILTGPDLGEAHLKHWPLARAPYLLESSVPGIFAAGDVRHESIKRVASAVGEGSVAVHFVHRHLASL